MVVSFSHGRSVAEGLGRGTPVGGLGIGGGTELERSVGGPEAGAAGEPVYMATCAETPLRVTDFSTAAAGSRLATLEKRRRAPPLNSCTEMTPGIADFSCPNSSAVGWHFHPRSSTQGVAGLGANLEETKERPERPERPDDGWVVGIERWESAVGRAGDGAIPYDSRRFCCAS